MSKQNWRVKEPGRCVFCDGTGMSEEHIWSDWLKGVLPSTATHTQTTIHEIRDDTRTAFLFPGLKVRQSAMNQRKLRNVCKTCNTGWMCRAIERDGRGAAPSEWKHPRWEFRGAKVVITSAGTDGRPPATREWAVYSDEREEPWFLDLDDPPVGFAAVYRFDGEGLVVCWDAGRLRHRSFETQGTGTTRGHLPEGVAPLGVTDRELREVGQGHRNLSSP